MDAPVGRPQVESGFASFGSVRGAGGSMLKPPMPGAIGGVATSATAWNVEDAVSPGFTPDDRRYCAREAFKTGLPVKWSSIFAMDVPVGCALDESR
jgi:hypothetical protein